MNAKLNSILGGVNTFFFLTRAPRFALGPVLSVAGAFACALFAAFLGPSLSASLQGDSDTFWVGQIADRDVTADRSFEYEDEEATRLRREAQERLVPAVFRFSDDATRESLSSFSRFAAFCQAQFRNRASAESFKLAVQAEYPGAFSRETIDAIYRAPARNQLLESAAAALRSLMEGGVFSVPASGLEGYNPDSIEVVRYSGAPEERDRRFSGAANVTLANVPRRIAAIVSSGGYPSALASIAPALLGPFVAENVFFSPEDSARRLENARERVDPVVKRVERGERILRRGFIVTKEDIAKLGALDRSSSPRGVFRAAGLILLLVLAFAMTAFMTGPRIVGRALKNSEVYLLAASASMYVLAAVFANGFSPGAGEFPAAILLPTAMFTMLLSVLIGPRVALAFSLALPTVAFVSGSFDSASFLFALISGTVGSFALQGAERRMDLIRAGAQLAIAQLLAAAGLLLSEVSLPVQPGPTLFWAAFNGFACGMATLGFLPLFEHALNAATPFRLIELSDLNSPLLKRLLTVAPGTYSHSVTVANLAESACREIGADALLARVGAYYHDIGKMDQPDYFVENQAAYNKHDDIQPRLSATVIRSHVKLGVEKARMLGLPKEVVDIIAEHHGNSVISWFYNEAMKREEQVSADDFCYQGNPPRSRESAVVMLADTVEAAVRTLKKPTMAKLEKFVQELIMSKFEQDQLSESELTFRDLETIKNAFVRVLAGHYHSRIEYPKLAREAVR